MANWILTGILAINAVMFVCMAAFFIKFRRIYDDIQYLFTPKGEGLPSPAAEVVNQIAESAGQALFRQVKTSFGANKSAEVRAGKAIDADIAEGMLQATNPGLATILDSIPGLKKTLRRNPALIDLAMEKLAGKFGGGAAPQGDAVPSRNNGHSQLTLDDL